MYHFFTDKNNIGDRYVYIEGGDFNHIKNVLRLKEGDEVSVGNGEDENDYRCVIEGFEDDRVVLKIMFVKKADVELPSKVYLYQCLPKGDKMEFIIQKCVELGVSEIIPVSSKRCVVKLDDKKAKSKIARWQSIAEAAGKQSKRAIVPFIGQVKTFKEAVEDAKKAQIKLIPYELCEDGETTKEIFNTLEGGKDIAIFIGSEGGFDEDEVQYAFENGFTPITLGRRILRTETAGMTVLAWISLCLEILKK